MALTVVETRLLRWMSIKRKKKDRIRNKVIKDSLGIAPIEDKVRENCLKWFGNIYRRPK